MELVINDFVIIPKLRGRAGEKKKKKVWQSTHVKTRIGQLWPKRWNVHLKVMETKTTG